MPKRAIYDPASMEAVIQELQSNPELSLRAAAKKYAYFGQVCSLN